MTHPFDGIGEKLKRSNESIKNLEAEIARFFQESDYPTLPKNNNKLLLEAITYHKDRPIPLRFSVLAGEIVHHLRSCLDHIVWIYSSPSYKSEHFRRIEFPIFEARPRDKNESTGYERKIKGIANTAVLALIEKLQPYNSPDPIDFPLFILHQMDIIDKHRELVLGIATGALELPIEIATRYVAYLSGDPKDIPANIKSQLENDTKFVPQVSFKDFGRREIEPVVPALAELNNFVVRVCDQFDRKLPNS
jgi:hypothetical protein